MKLYAHVAAPAQPDDDWPVELTEATLTATPAELRRIAAFISGAADRMEQRGRDYEHEHLQDHAEGFEEAPQLIIFSPDAKPN